MADAILPRQEAGERVSLEEIQQKVGAESACGRRLLKASARLYEHLWLISEWPDAVAADMEEGATHG